MIKLTVRPARTSFSGPEKQLKRMFKSLRVKDKNSYWRQRWLLKKFAYFSGVKDTATREKKIEKLKESVSWVKFYDKRTDTFSTGLLSKVTKFLDKHKIKYSVKDKRKPLPKFKEVSKFHFDDKVETRPEQIAAVNAALQKGRGILHCATNFGKTEVACAVISEFYRQTSRMPRVLFLIHRAGLAQQTAERFGKHLPEFRVAMLGAGKKIVGRKPGITVATVQTASNLLAEGDYEFSNFQENCDILFVDEFHVNKAWQCDRIVRNNSALMRFGLSGTINKENKIKMMHYVGMTGPIISETRNEDLVRLGRSAKPVVRFIEIHDKRIPKKLKFSGGYNLGVVNNSFRNAKIVKEAFNYLKKNFKILITVARIKHGLKLKQMLENRCDLPIEFLSGSSKMFHRKRVIKDFERGKVSVLIASPIFDTGVDIPSIGAWVNAAAGKGWELTLQRLGRVLRKKEGDNRVFISDFVDMHNHYLMEHSLARIKHYRNENIAEITIIGEDDV